MTPRYVAHSWDVPPELVIETLAIAPDGSGRRVTLAELAQMRSMPLPLLMEQLQDAIDAHRAGLAP